MAFAFCRSEHWNQHHEVNERMEKKIDIAGLQLDNCSVREAMAMLDKASAERAFFSVAEINTDILLRTGTDERVKKAVEGLNLTILSDEAVLKAVGQNSPQRQHEIADRSFFRELMRKIEQDQVPVCLLGDTSARVLSAKEFLLQQFPHMNITDVEIIDECKGGLDNLVNEINAGTPDVVVSLLPSPMQEYFFMDYRENLSAALWYGTGAVPPARHRGWLVPFIQERKRVRALTRFMDLKKKATQHE
jgi:N-acetylglucosaminyldiphosphoundecaprenol N-acetyl-beta-D-mannosaminyltransferase